MLLSQLRIEGEAIRSWHTNDRSGMSCHSLRGERTHTARTNRKFSTHVPMAAIHSLDRSQMVERPGNSSESK